MFIDSPGAGETFPGVRLGYNLLGRSVLECAKNVAEMTAVAGSGKQRHPQDYNTRLIPPPASTDPEAYFCWRQSWENTTNCGGEGMIHFYLRKGRRKTGSAIKLGLDVRNYRKPLDVGDKRPKT
ncbi:hypothetical protein Bbelb_419120 [Branchiostoma belcheri]|nr:hypothetical protein Bbelb_419120 [Branchiostoma belcheri]